MSINRIKEKVRDGYLQDIPEDIQNKIFTINKLIINTINEKINQEHYEDLSKSRWAMSCLDEFKTIPTLKGEVGSVRVYQAGKQYKCMIQVTGHFTNHQYGWIEELLHEIICDTYQDVKPEIRKKFDATLSNEGDKGSPHEGFDVFLSNMKAKEIWNLFEGRKTKTIKESSYNNHIEIGENLLEFYQSYSNIMTYDQYFNEASHGKLKYDFRLGWDYNTGNQIKVVYSLDNIQIDGVGDFYWKYNKDNRNNDGSLKQTEDEYTKWVQNNISSKGNNDHRSHGQKVLAIIDLVTNRKLSSVKLLNPFCEWIDTHAKSQSQENLEKARKFADQNPDKYITNIKVGDIDNKASFKATSWGYNTTDKKTNEDFRFNQIAKKEMFKFGRGHKMNDIMPNDMHITDYDGKPPIMYGNPNKKNALIELNARAFDRENLLKQIMSSLKSNNYPRGWTRQDVVDFYNQIKTELNIIDNDIATIKTGKYDLSIMNKYKLDDQNIRIFKRALNKESVNVDMEPSMSLESLSCIAERINNRNEINNFESYGLDDYFNESSHGKLKYDYRMARDTSNGHVLKIIYSLDNIVIDKLGNSNLEAFKKLGINDEGEAISYVQTNIKKIGNTDHRSHGQKVLAIIDLVTNKRIKSAECIGPWDSGINTNQLMPDSNTWKDWMSWLNHKDDEYKSRHVFKIEEGKVDMTSSYKSTYWGKNKPVTDMEIQGYKIPIINNNSIAQAEKLPYGRGAKVGDIDVPNIVTVGEDDIKFKHPSKKDIRKNPERYRERLSDEEFNKLMKNKTPDEIKEDIESVKEDINSMNDPSSNIDPNKKESFISNLKRNLIRLFNWLRDLLKRAGKSLGILESVLEDLPDGFFIEESYDGSEYSIRCIDYLEEKSHGKLKYDFRFGFDLNTGHKVKVVYSLDNIQVTMGGHGYDIDGTHDNNSINIDRRKSSEVTSEIQNNIKHKGNVDHESKGQKIIAIVDRKTGNNLKSCRLIGIGTKDPIISSTGAHSKLEINPKYLKDIQQDYRHIPEVHVGDIETDSSFKTTHAFKEKDLVKHEKDWFGDDIASDTINSRLQAVETLKHGRGAKLNDSKPKIFGLGDTEYNHPSKKDIKKNPDLYKKESVDNINQFNEDLYDNYNNDIQSEDSEQIENFISKYINDNSNPEPIKTNITDIWAYIAPEDVNKYFSHNEISEIMNMINIVKKVMKDMESIPKYDPLFNNTHGIFNWLINGMLSGFGYVTLENCINEVNNGDQIIEGKVFILCQDASPICNLYDEIFGFEDVLFEIFRLLDKTGIDYSNYYLFDKRFEYNELYFDYIRELIQRIKDYDTDGYIKSMNFEYGNESLSLAVNLPKDLTLKLFNNIQKMRKNINESKSNTPEYNVDMTEIQAKRTLHTLSQDIINKFSDNNYKVTQYTANIYANIITKNLLPKWANGYKKLSITLDSYQSFLTFEFKIPTMSQDFISRFINGREPINAFLHRVPEIKIKMSPRIFHTMKDPDDAFNFFKAAVKYYDQKVEKYSKQLMSEILKLNHSMKHLISTTSLSGIVTYPMQLLFVFDNVHMDNQKTFLLDDDDLKAINSFMKNIYTKYAAPEKEKKKIIEDVKTLVKDLREACDNSENIKSLYYLPEAVENYLTGKYDYKIKEADNKFINEQVDIYDMNNPSSNELKYIREKFGVKKLKRLPTDLVAYISIETESINNANDKLMIASYCLSKIEIVEWYIELLEVGSEKYIVPHSLPYLQNLRTQLLECYKDIMAVKVSSNKNKPIIQIDYPSRYEG